jgi:hypothetical protein
MFTANIIGLISGKIFTLCGVYPGRTHVVYKTYHFKRWLAKGSGLKHIRDTVGNNTTFDVQYLYYPLNVIRHCEFCRVTIESYGNRYVSCLFFIVFTTRNARIKEGYVLYDSPYIC